MAEHDQDADGQWHAQKGADDTPDRAPECERDDNHESRHVERAAQQGRVKKIADHELHGAAEQHDDQKRRDGVELHQRH